MAKELTDKEKLEKANEIISKAEKLNAETQAKVVKMYAEADEIMKSVSEKSFDESFAETIRAFQKKQAEIRESDLAKREKLVKLLNET